jgi:hypothetical protein
VRKIIISAAALAMSSCGEIADTSGRCVGVSDSDVRQAIYRNLEEKLSRGKEWVGIPVGSAEEFSVASLERRNSPKGKPSQYVVVQLEKSGVDGRLVAFLHDDCDIEWSPQFNGS